MILLSTLQRFRSISRMRLAWIMLFFTLVNITSVAAVPPSAVTLIYFRGIGHDNEIRLEWATATEFETAGFRLERAESSSGPFSQLDDIGFVSAAGQGITGATYSVTDRSQLQQGSTYWYLLTEYEFSGLTNQFGPIMIIAQSPTSTPTVLPTSTTAPTAESPPQVTTTPTPSSSSIVPSPTLVPTTQTQVTPTSATTGNGESVVASVLEPSLGLFEPAEAFAQLTTAEPAEAYPAFSTEPASDAATPVDFDPYPVQVGPGPVNSPDSYPVPQIEPNRGNLTQDPPSRSDAVQPFNAETDLSNQGEQESTSDGNSSTAILWIGFIAAALIFIAGILSSIYYFDRDRARRR